MANKSLPIVNLDFDGIKSAIRDYLSSQTEFQDYNFEGSGLSVILNILASNSTYLAYYLQMVASEMFLDSADRRESIVSIAKSLNYTPRSRNAATAQLQVTVVPPDSVSPPAKITINKNNIFHTVKDDVTYNFMTLDATSVDYDVDNNRYRTNIVVREGVYYTFKYTVDTDVNQRFIIPNNGVDLSTVNVRVQKSASDGLLTVFSLANDVNTLNGDSKVYFLQEVENSQYEVYFGDGVIGKALEDGNLIYIDYLACNAEGPNGAKIFVSGSPIAGFDNVTVVTLNSAYGGEEREDKESVRFEAPKNYEAQNRAVTVEDYKTLIRRDYPNVDSVAVWGGEDDDPPKYGKVFLSLKPVSGYVLTELTKQTIVKRILQYRNVVSIIPEIIDPDYLFVKVNSLVKYNAETTNRTADQIKDLVLSAVLNFSSGDIGQFDRILRYSKLTRIIDAVEPSITNNLTTLKMEKRFKPRLNITETYTLKFYNAIIPGTLTSNKFVDTLDPTYVSGDQYFFDDDGNGIIRIYKFIGTTKRYTKAKAGTINYDTGTIILTKFRPQSLDLSNLVKITVNPVTNDIIPVRNNIILVELADLTVNMQANTPVLV